MEAARLVESGRVVSMARDMTVDRSEDAVAAGADRPPVLVGSVRNVFGIDTDNGYFWERYESTTAALVTQYRRAVPRGLERPRLQWARVRGGGVHRGRLHGDGDHQPEGRSRHSRRADRHAGHGGAPAGH